MVSFACPECQAVYRVDRHDKPADHEPHCEQCDCAFPDKEADGWLHYRSTE